MDPVTLLGFGISIVALFVFMNMEGVSPSSLIFLPAIVLVIVATFGAAMASQTMDDLHANRVAQRVEHPFEDQLMNGRVFQGTHAIDHKPRAKLDR